MLAQGATDLAYTCWQDTTKRLDPTLEEDLKALQPTVTTSRYQPLEDLLKNGQWQEADQETYRLMITAVGKEEGEFFTREELLNFPCDELKAIDGLWVKYSQGKFGFSVQKEIWQTCGSPMTKDKKWDEFCVRVGWQDSTSNHYLPPNSLKFDPNFSPAGELPIHGMPVVGGVASLLLSTKLMCI